MLDTGTATRPTGGYQYAAGEETQAVDEDFTFSSPCKVQSRNVVARESEAGGRTVVTTRLELHLPVDSEPLQSGDLFTITAAHEVSLAVVGTVYRVTAPVDGTLKTARRYEVERS